jgi:hypothetical protein
MSSHATMLIGSNRSHKYWKLDRDFRGADTSKSIMLTVSTLVDDKHCTLLGENADADHCGVQC